MRKYILELYEQCQPLLERPETISEAIEKLKLIIKVDPNFAPANYSLGYAYFIIQDFEKSLEYLKKAKQCLHFERYSPITLSSQQPLSKIRDEPYS